MLPFSANALAKVLKHIPVFPGEFNRNYPLFLLKRKQFSFQGTNQNAFFFHRGLVCHLTRKHMA